MADTKTFASLSSGLLARKGGAKPAMRPQGYHGFGQLEDLGWNDMGQSVEPADEHVPSSIAALTPVGGRPQGEPSPEQFVGEEDRPEPAVVEQQRSLEQSFAAIAEEAIAGESVDRAEPEPEPAHAPIPEPSPVVSLPQRQPRPMPARAKTAFTLRLDPERHFKLRLACAVVGRSAQQLVTGALDDFLDSLPEVGALADRMPAEAGKRSR